MDPVVDENQVNGVMQNIKMVRQFPRERKGVIGRKLAGKRQDRSVLAELTNLEQGNSNEARAFDGNDQEKNNHPAKIRKSNNVSEVYSDISGYSTTHYSSSSLCIASPGVSMEMASLQLTFKQDFDIDSCNRMKHIYVSEYAETIQEHFFHMETRDAPNAIYLDDQPDLNFKMRSILIDWLVDVHYKFKLQEQTLYITVNLIDRYLMKTVIKRQSLQLVGVTAMFLASKYEEIYPPEVYDFVRITDEAYDEHEIFDMEEKMLKALSYRISNPTAYQFLQRFTQASKSKDPRTDKFTNYALTRILQEYSMLKYLPSTLAASAVFLSRVSLTELPTWPRLLEHHTRHSELDLAPCVRDMKHILLETYRGTGKQASLNAVKRKYSTTKFLQVALIPLSLGQED